jgi:ATP phosphoribosyltransferase
VATKYVNLTRGFLAEHGVVDYRIVESLGATEGAPAAGAAELIVDITTTGTTLAANGLKVIEDGTILRSQANLVAARKAAWGASERESARVILDRIAAQGRAGQFREVRTLLPGSDEAFLATVKERFGATAPFGGPAASGVLTLHCPAERMHGLANFLREKGADGVSVAKLEYVFARDNPLYARLPGVASQPD